MRTKGVWVCLLPEPVLNSLVVLCVLTAETELSLCAFWGSESQVVFSVMLIRNLALQIKKKKHEFCIL